MKWVYLLQSESDPAKRYRRLADDLDQRLGEDNAGRVRSTAEHKPWRIVVAIRFEDDGRAAQFEKYMKSGSGHAFASRHFWSS